LDIKCQSNQRIGPAFGLSRVNQQTSAQRKDDEEPEKEEGSFLMDRMLDAHTMQ
jgi:hypothetical protein